MDTRDQRPPSRTMRCGDPACDWHGGLEETVHPKHVPTMLLCPICYEVVDEDDERGSVDPEPTALDATRSQWASQEFTEKHTP